MAYRPHGVQADAHRAFLTDGFDRGAIFWGRRVGKSTWSRHHLIASALYKQGPYWIVFDTKQHAKEVMWDALLREIPKGLISKADATDLKITFKYFKNSSITIPGLGKVDINHDETKAPSTIVLSGSDYAERDKGNEAMGIILDEYQDQNPDAWQSTYEPFLATTQGWACFMGTAMGYNHWYEMLQDAQEQEDWFYSEATWRDNPMITKDWIEKSRQTAERRGKLDIWLREYELQFMTSQGAVYPMFDRKVHIRKPIDMPEEGTVYGAWDFGWTEGHPMAFNFILIDKHGKWWVFDEIHGTEITMDAMIEMIKQKLGDRRMTAIVADSARPDLIEVARSKGLTVLPSPKRQGAIQAGITLLGTRMRPKIQLLGQPEPDMYITSNCRNTIMEFEKYKYREHKEDRPQNELPLKMDDNHPDAIRYLALYLKYGQVEKRKPPQNNFKKRINTYGMLRK